MYGVKFERDGTYNVIKVGDMYSTAKGITLFFGRRVYEKLGGEENCIDLTDVSFADGGPTDIGNCMDVLYSFKNLNEQAGFETAYLKGVIDSPSETQFTVGGHHVNFEFI